jgi:hypothetical protein
MHEWEGEDGRKERQEKKRARKKEWRMGKERNEKRDDKKEWWEKKEKMEVEEKEEWWMVWWCVRGAGRVGRGSIWVERVFRQVGGVWLIRGWFWACEKKEVQDGKG